MYDWDTGCFEVPVVLMLQRKGGIFTLFSWKIYLSNAFCCSDCSILGILLLLRLKKTQSMVRTADSFCKLHFPAPTLKQAGLPQCVCQGIQLKNRGLTVAGFLFLGFLWCRNEQGLIEKCPWFPLGFRIELVFKLLMHTVCRGPDF